MVSGRLQLLGIIILFHTFYANTNGWRPFKLTIKNVTTESYSHLWTVNATLHKSGAISFWVSVLDSVKHPHAQTEVYLDSGNGKYQMELLNRTVDLCEVFRNIYYEPLVQIFYKMLLERGSWPTSCPVLKSKFSVENLMIDVERLPPYLPEKKGFVNLIIKNKDNGQFFILNTVQIFFEVENVGVNRLKSLAKKTVKKSFF